METFRPAVDLTANCTLALRVHIAVLYEHEEEERERIEREEVGGNQKRQLNYSALSLRNSPEPPPSSDTLSSVYVYLLLKYLSLSLKCRQQGMLRAPLVTCKDSNPGFGE